MIKNIIFRAKEAVEILKDQGFAFLVRRFIYKDLEMVLTEMDLGNLAAHAEPPGEGLELVEITPDLLEKNSFPVRSDYTRSLNYLNKGYHGFALTLGHEVCGYIWYTMIDTARYNANHPDVRLLGIASEDNCAYMFSMYVKPDMRRKNLAECLQYSVFDHLHGLGVARAYGTYETRNIPALWVHRKLHWKEVKKFKVSQFIFLKSASLQP